MGNNFEQASLFFWQSETSTGTIVDSFSLFAPHTTFTITTTTKPTAMRYNNNIVRFNPVKILGAGTYMLLRPSKVLPKGGNNQVRLGPGKGNMSPERAFSELGNLLAV